MKTQFVRTQTEDGLILQGLFFEPDTVNNKVILHIHGMGGNFYENHFLDAMARIFTQNDWAFLSVNTRGHDFIADFPLAGEKEKYKRVGNAYERFEDCIPDIKAWIDWIESRYQYIILQGHSLGTSKVVYYLAKTNDTRISKLILISPADMIGLFEDDKNHVTNLPIAKKMIAESRGNEFLPTLLWDWYYLTANTYTNFGERENAIDVFNTYNKGGHSILADITVPIISILGSIDDCVIVPHQEALEIIKKKSENCPAFDSAIINGASHSYFGHEDELANIIVHWLSR